MMTKIYCLVTIILYSQIIISTSQPIQNVTAESHQYVTEGQESSVLSNHTTGELIAQQTEAIKKIETDHNQLQPSTVDYPVVTKLEPDYSAEAKKQIENLSAAELKIKCQHLSKLIQANKTNQGTLTRPSNHKPYDYQRRPVYIQPKTTFRPKYSTTPKPHGFYITQHSTATQKSVINASPSPIRYIRLEPVILQKTILSDGRTVYYWHRSLPTAVEIAKDSAQKSQISTSPYQRNPSHNYYDQSLTYSTSFNSPYTYGNLPYGYVPSSQNPFSTYITAYQNTQHPIDDSSEEEQKPTEATTESSTTSTTEQTSYGYGFGSFLPFYSYRQDVTSTTTEPTTTTGTTTVTPGTITEKLKTDDLLYAQQLKFIIPVPYDDQNGGARLSARNPWDFDQYAYYPRDLQPNTMNLQVPYNPTFHMIRAIAVPSTDRRSSEETYSSK